MSSTASGVFPEWKTSAKPAPEQATGLPTLDQQRIAGDVFCITSQFQSQWPRWNLVYTSRHRGQFVDEDFHDGSIEEYVKAFYGEMFLQQRAS